MSGRPIVVLAGWLGCRQKHLHRYEKLYMKLGFDVLSYIATPRMVVGSTFQPIRICSPPPNRNWPASTTSSSAALVDDGQIMEGDMQSLAWHILGRIHNKQPHCFIYHGFSNGGCFLWEQILRIFQHYNQKNEANGEEQDDNNNIICRDIVVSLQQRLNGIVFDSCPAWYAGIPTSLRLALQYCTLSEKIDIVVRYGPGVILYDGKLETEQRDRRCHELFRTLYEENTLDIPELYLYSQNDLLTNFEQLDKLVHYRQSLLATPRKRMSPVINKVWKQSKHCAHLLSHPIDYEQEIEMFTTTCLRRSRL